jgi:hypothetical protein
MQQGRPSQQRASVDRHAAIFFPISFYLSTLALAVVVLKVVPWFE